MSEMNQYLQLDKQFHLQSQVLAKFARSLVKQEDDDSHTNLGLDVVSHCMFSRWAEREKTHFRLELQLNTGAYIVRGADLQIIEQFDSRELIQVEQSINQWFAAEFSAKELFEPLHFDIPKYEVDADEFVHDGQTIEKWLMLRDLANWSCNWVARHFQKETEPRIWPHHFDTGIYFEVDDQLGIGYGLAMADDLIETPYFYCTPYGLNDHSIEWNSFGHLKMGEWFQSENFRSAVKPVKGFAFNDLYGELMVFVRSALAEITKKAER